MDRDVFFLEEAFKEAMVAKELGEVPIGAILVIDHQIVARSYNQVERLSDPTAHAEMIAISAATHALQSKYLPTSKLYVTLEPCIMCAGALFWGQLGGLFFAARDFKQGYHTKHGLSLHPKTSISHLGGVWEERSGDLLRSFFEDIRQEKRLYSITRNG